MQRKPGPLRPQGRDLAWHLASSCPVPSIVRVDCESSRAFRGLALPPGASSRATSTLPCFGPLSPATWPALRPCSSLPPTLSWPRDPSLHSRLDLSEQLQAVLMLLLFSAEYQHSERPKRQPASPLPPASPVTLWPVTRKRMVKGFTFSRTSCCHWVTPSRNVLLVLSNSESPTAGLRQESRLALGSQEGIQNSF